MLSRIEGPVCQGSEGHERNRGRAWRMLEAACSEKRLVWALLLPVVMSTGCNNRFAPPKGGAIFVGQPQVLSRESIVPERQMEAEWLLKQLDETPNATSLQGLSNTLIQQTLTAQLTASFDPLGGQTQDERVKLEKENLEAQRSEQQLKRQIEEAKLKNELQKVTEQKTTPEGGGATGGLSATDQAKLDAIDKKIEAINQSIAKIEEKTKAVTMNENPFTAATASEAKPGQAVLTSYERLQDRMAYRAQVHAARRDKMLDETHDLCGGTLYEMKFTVTMVPPPGKELYAIVKVEACKPENSNVSGNLFCNALANRIYFEYGLIRSEYWHNASESDFRRDLEPSGTPNGQSADNPLDGLQPELGLRPVLLPVPSWEWLGTTERESDTKTYARPSPGFPSPKLSPNGLARAAEKYLRAKYAKLGSFFTIQVIESEDPNGEPDFLVRTLTPPGPSCEGLIEELGNLEKVRVLSVEPREYAQNISETLARQNLFQMALKLSAALKAGVSGGAETNLTKDERRLLASVDRRPLALGFAETNDSSDSFGWVLGPKFEIDNWDKPAYSQAPVVYPLTASLVVPAWASSLTLKVSYGWYRKDMKKPVWVGTSRQFTVRLAPDMDGLVQAAVERFYGIDRRPRVLIPDDGYILQQGAKGQSLLLRGLHLWRNPQVYVNAVRADTVEIVPDMYGICAHFDSLLTIPAGKADLVVACTTGHAYIPKVVTIRSTPSGQVEPYVSLAQSRASWSTADKPLAVDLKIDSDRMGPILPRFIGYACREGFAADREQIRDIPLSAGSSLKLAIPVRLRYTDADAYPLAVDVRVLRNANDADGTSVMKDPKTVVVFNDEAKIRLHLKQTPGQPLKDNILQLSFTEGKNEPQSITVEILLADKDRQLFYRAYPGFSNDQKLSLRTTSGTPLKPIEVTKPDFGKGQFEFSIPPANATSEGATFSNLVIRCDPSGQQVPIVETLKLVLVKPPKP